TVRHDWVTLSIANEYLKSQQPKLFCVALAETDDWGHERRYDRVLQAANYFDESLRTLWVSLQASRRYRGKTSLVILTDHGRGHGIDDWVSHKSTIPGSAEIWIAVIGPDTPDRGEAKSAGTYSQSQVAATILRFYGLDHRDFNPDSARPIGAAFE
ncbi:MAG: alkaline phosphatase family protein, partial [Planctomycetota bacterium]